MVDFPYELLAARASFYSGDIFPDTSTIRALECVLRIPEIATYFSTPRASQRRHGVFQRSGVALDCLIFAYVAYKARLS